MKSVRKHLASTFMLACLAVPMTVSFEALQANGRTVALERGNIDAFEHAIQLRKTAQAKFPHEWISTATLLAEQSEKYDAISIYLLERALESDPAYPQAWALISFLKARRSGEFTPAAQLALSESIQRCPFCEQSILRWRLTFALQHWSSLDLETQKSIFEGADFLRWWYLDYAFLETVRKDAIKRGIAFDDLRRAVNTPVRPHEVGRLSDTDNQ